MTAAPRFFRLQRERTSRLGRRLMRGLDATPDPARAARMAAYDALPWPVRKALNWGPFDYNAHQIARYFHERGEEKTLRQIVASDVDETRRWRQERAAALTWARRTFQIGGARGRARS